MSRLVGTIHDHLAAAGHHVSYLTTDDVPPAMRSRLGRLAFQFVVRRTAVAAARRGAPYDIINVHEPHGAVVALRRRGLGGAAVVAMTHGVERRGWEIALRHPPSRPGLKTRLVHPLITLAPSSVTLRRADHVICLNTDDRVFLTRTLGVPEFRISRVTPGADPVFGAAAAQRSYEHGRRLLFAGTWLPRKGVQELAHAFTTLLDRGHDVHLDVLGAGADPAAVAGAFGNTAAARVRLRSSRNDAEIAAAMRDADVFVLPSLFEGTPLTLIEAMWSGLPVVTTATAGMKDVVSDGRTGLLVPPGDAGALAAAIGRLTNDADLRAPARHRSARGGASRLHLGERRGDVCLGVPSRRGRAMGESRDAYDGWHARVAGQAALDTPWHRLVRESLSIERDVDGRRVLEIACGRGDFAEWCATHGRPSVFAAADFSMTAVRLARARVLTSAQAARVSFVQADAQAIALAGDSMDTVICSKRSSTFLTLAPPCASWRGFCAPAAGCSSPPRTTSGRLAATAATCA